MTSIGGLLYMHLDRLEKARLVTGHLELSGDGKAMKYFELAPFELRLTPQDITAAVRSQAGSGPDTVGPGPDTEGPGQHTDKKESDRRPGHMY